MEVLVSCPVNPTEDTTKVGKALDNLLGGLEFVITKGSEVSDISGTFKNRDVMNHVRQAIHETRIIDAARKRLESNWNGTSTKIYFDKQAALAKKTRIIDDNQELPPLGCIEIVLVFSSEQEYDQFVKWFTPPTKDGRIVHN
ncbi:MAG: RNA-binding domain-containing protein [Candidatus Thorarchaeota archaeon]